MKTTTARQNETRAWFQASVAPKSSFALGALAETETDRPSTGARVEVAQDDLDDLSMHVVRGQRQPYEMPGLGWRYG
ncbi:hypothetical protein [Pendulispora albinea]|uniref:Uncharacterized protein n=1 Tax=Pendulispora albinea TaxID=2741071 RepID=A0ABZ2M5A6_9BACT